MNGNVETTVWPLRSDSANFAVLVVDFDTYEFEGGQLVIYAPCATCDGDSLPVTVDFEPIGQTDSPGKVLVRYVETRDSVFYGTFGPWGGFSLRFPPEFHAPDSFKTVLETPQEPLSREFLNPDWTDPIDDSYYIPKADSAWSVVQDLDITKDFALKPYRVLVLLFGRYKWIVFIYRGIEN